MKDILRKAYNAGLTRSSFEHAQESETDEWVSIEPPTFEKWYESLVKKSSDIQNVITWATTETIPEEYASLNGIEMPYECRYACHREGDKYYCDQSGDEIKITHWEYATKPPE